MQVNVILPIMCCLTIGNITMNIECQIRSPITNSMDRIHHPINNVGRIHRTIHDMGQMHCPIHIFGRIRHHIHPTLLSNRIMLAIYLGETGASCYNFHSKSIFHKNMQARDFFRRDLVM